MSAGFLLYRRSGGELELLLAHPGGPYWARRDSGAWTLPKGLVEDGEDPLDAARREFAEEVGAAPPVDAVSLGEVRQAGGKRVLAWAGEGDFDPGSLASNEFELECSPRSGRIRRYPEIDRVAWFAPEEAGERILPAQRPFIERLLDLVAGR